MTFPPHRPTQAPTDPPSGGPDSGGRRNRGLRIGAVAAGAVLLALAGGGIALLVRHDGGSTPVAAPSRPAAAPSSPVVSPPSTAASPSPVASAQPSADRDLPYVVLKPGTCFDHPNLTKGLAHVTERPCGAPHDGEAVANVTVEGRFTKDSEIAAAVRGQCSTAGQRTASRQPEGRRFYSYVLTPSVELYGKGYDQATCTLTASRTVGGEKLTGKLR